MRDGVRRQLEEAQRELGFKYIRFHGIFNDEIMIYGTDGYSWSYADELFDYILSLGLKPFLELTFMPSELAAEKRTLFRNGSIMSKPRDLKEWAELIKTTALHFIERYGEDEVLSWYFEVWNEPDYEGVFWNGTREEYFEFYRATATALKEVNKNIKTGGPSVTINENCSLYTADFIEYCRRSQTPCDFFTFHIFCDMAQHSGTPKNLHTASVLPLCPFRDVHTVKELLSAQRKLPGILTGDNFELHVVEWNISVRSQMLIRDTAFMAPYIVDTVINCAPLAKSLGYWTVSDSMEERRMPPALFHGGFGLMTRNGIKKPAYHAYRFLRGLYGETIERGKNYVITRGKDNFALIIYNCAAFDTLTAFGDLGGITATDRYAVFENRAEIQTHVEIFGLSGTYAETSETVCRECGSAFDEWVKMGAPEKLTRADEEYLKKKSEPEKTRRIVETNGKYEKSATVPPHGCIFIKLEKIHYNHYYSNSCYSRNPRIFLTQKY